MLHIPSLLLEANHVDKEVLFVHFTANRLAGIATR
jgi:hypothetical protein